MLQPHNTLGNKIKPQEAYINLLDITIMQRENGQWTCTLHAVHMDKPHNSLFQTVNLFDHQIYADNNLSEQHLRALGRVLLISLLVALHLTNLLEVSSIHTSINAYQKPFK